MGIKILYVEWHLFRWSGVILRAARKSVALSLRALFPVLFLTAIGPFIVRGFFDPDSIFDSCIEAEADASERAAVVVLMTAVTLLKSYLQYHITVLLIIFVGQILSFLLIAILPPTGVPVICAVSVSSWAVSIAVTGWKVFNRFDKPSVVEKRLEEVQRTSEQDIFHLLVYGKVYNCIPTLPDAVVKIITAYFENENFQRQ
jgi:hypothetical protein